MANLQRQSEQNLKLMTQPVIRSRIFYAGFTFLILGIDFKWLRKCKKRKIPWQAVFIPGGLCEYTGSTLLWNSWAHITKRKLWWVFSQIVLFMASFQRNKVLPPRHFPDLGLQMEWFLPQTSQTSLFLLLQLFFSLKGRSTPFGEHQTNVLAAIYLHFLLHAGCPCTFSVESESPFVLWSQWFLAILPIEIITSKPNGRSYVFVSNYLSTLTVRLGNTCRLSPPHSARGRKILNWQVGYPGLLLSETNVLLIWILTWMKRTEALCKR